MSAPFPCITYVTDTASVKIEDLWVRVARSVDPVCVLVRDKDLPLEARFTLAMEIRLWDATLGSPLTVLFAIPQASDLEPTLEWAAELGLDGVHFASAAWSAVGARAARQGLAGAIEQPAWVSVACHSAHEVELRALEGADIVFLSPIFRSPGKGAPLGVVALRNAARRLAEHAPATRLVALGGVEPSQVASCFEAGAHGVASIRHELSLIADA